MSRSNHAACLTLLVALIATPFYQGIYEMHHLPIPQNLQGNIEYCFYESGHMVYAKDPSLRQMHDNVADFIRRTGRTAQ